MLTSLEVIECALAKENQERCQPPLSLEECYTIDETCGLVWTGTSNLTAEDLPSECTLEQRGALQEAAEFLEEILAGGPQPSQSVKEEAKARGISAATLRRAQTRLGVTKQPGGFGRPWLLALRSVAQSSQELLISKV
jgi:hypothetical protein